MEKPRENLEDHNTRMLERPFSNHTCGLSEKQSRELAVEMEKHGGHCYGFILERRARSIREENSKTCEQCKREKERKNHENENRTTENA